MYTEFYLGSVKWNIKYVDYIEGDLLGVCSKIETTIIIIDKVLSGGSVIGNIASDLVENTLFHEIAHAIQFSLGYRDTDMINDEHFIQSSANMWQQVFKTLK